MACDYPFFHVSMAEYHNLLVLGNKLLGQTLTLARISTVFGYNKRWCTASLVTELTGESPVGVVLSLTP